MGQGIKLFRSRCKEFYEGYLAKEPYFGLRGDDFKSVKELMSFIYGFEFLKNIKLSKQSISNLKNRMNGEFDIW